MFFKRSHIAVSYILLFGIQILSAFGVSAQAYNFRQLSIQNGLPQSQAYAIIFDSNEHAWIGTQGGGICRYDGVALECFTKTDSLLSNRIYSIAQIRDEIFIGQKGGVTVFDLEGNFQKNIRIPDNSATVSDITEYNKEVYFATDRGLIVLEKNRPIVFIDNPNLVNQNILRFFKTVENELWLCTTKGLLSFSDPFNKINQARGLKTEQVECAVQYIDKWLIGTYGGGLVVYEKSKGIYMSDQFSLFNNQIITSLFVSATNEVWIGTMNNGVYTFSEANKTIKNYHTGNGLANNHVRIILADHWNNIWIGTSGGGVSIFQNSPFVKYSTESGLNGNYVYAVINDDKNNIWVGTEGAGVLRINDTSSTLFDEEYGFHSTKVRTMFSDRQGDIWFGTEENGLGIFTPSLKKDTIFSYTQQNGLTSNFIKCFAQDPRTNEIFIATINGGIMRVKKSVDFPQNVQFKKYKITSGKLPERFSNIFIFQGNLWYTSSENEYGFIKNGEVISYALPDVNLRNAVCLKNEIWIGSSDNGILQVTIKDDVPIDQKWITTADGLSSNNIYQLLWDENRLWVGTEKGLDRLTFDSSLVISEIMHFGSEEGFEGVETNSNAIFKDANNDLWFGTVNGLYVYKGGEINYDQKAPPVLLMNDFKILYESIETTEYASYFDKGKMIKKLLLPYDKNHIGFSFKAIHYTHAKNIRYRWKLEGIDKNWTPPSTNNEPTYGYLPPGSYSFMVKASIDNNWDDVLIRQIDFEIDQPYWQKWWFRLTYYLTIVVLIFLIILIVIIRLKRKNRRFKQKYEMEKNLIELEQKALRLQMNPHFIFNVINSIHNLIILNEPDKARYALSKFSKLMRRVLENSREKSISIDNEIETLENYVQLEKLTSGSDVSILFEVDENIDSAEELLPPLMIQPFVENAIIHGLKQLDYQGQIKISFKLIDDNVLECCIQDNGRGREFAETIKAQKENYHKSTALKVTQERLASINQKVNFIPFEIIDLKDENDRPSGTKVIIRLLV